MQPSGNQLVTNAVNYARLEFLAYCQFGLKIYGVLLVRCADSIFLSVTFQGVL